MEQTPQQPLSAPPPTTEKPTLDRQKDRDFLLHLESYLAKRDGVDKLLKISRYTAKLLLSTDADAPSTRLKSFESSVGLSRKAFRLGKFVQDVNALRFSRITDRQSLILSLVAYLGEGTYYFIEQFVWLSKSGLIDKRHLWYLQKMSAWTELIGYVGSMGLKIRDLMELTEDEGRLAKSLEVGLTRGDACRGEEARLRKVRQKVVLKMLSIVQDLADAIMSLADVTEGKGSFVAPPAVIASAGLISALISAHKNWGNPTEPRIRRFRFYAPDIYNWINIITTNQNLPPRNGLRTVVFGFYWISVRHRSRTEDQRNGQQQEEKERPGAIVSNHVSYIDILYHMSSSFPSFVAKRSVGKLPLVGIISKCLGCVFVKRESKSSDFKGVAGVVTERVREAHQNKDAPMMMLFPEGTTTNGEYLLPFKTGAFLSKAPVRPVILRYPYQRFSPAWDSISGARHVIFLLCQFINHLEVIYLPVYYPSQEEKDDAKLYANNVRRLMAMEGNLIMSDIGLSEKRVYHAALHGNNSLPRVLHQKED